MSHIFIFSFCDEYIWTIIFQIHLYFLIVIKTQRSSWNAVTAYMHCKVNEACLQCQGPSLLLRPAKLQLEMLTNNINAVINTTFTAHISSFCRFDKEADTTETQLRLYQSMPPPHKSHLTSHTPGWTELKLQFTDSGAKFGWGLPH